MALKSLSSYISLPSPEITFAKIINTCVCMCGVQGFIYVGLYVSGCKCGGVANMEECIHVGVEVSLTLGDILNNCPLYLLKQGKHRA